VEGSRLGGWVGEGEPAKQKKELPQKVLGRGGRDTLKGTRGGWGDETEVGKEKGEEE